MEQVDLRVSDLKQYVFCPRVVFYSYVTPVDKKTTPKMERGRIEELRLDRLERRRKLKRYGLATGVRRFRVALRSDRLGLAGVIDMLVETGEEVHPVDFKFTGGGVRENHVAQLGGYALLLDEATSKTVTTGFIYLIPPEDAVPVPLDKALRDATLGRLEEIRAMITGQSMPAPTAVKARYTDCEFRNWCGDTL